MKIAFALLSLAVASAAASAEPGVYPIDRDGYPDVCREWGDTWIKRINGLMPGASRKAAQSRECDRVEYVGLSDRSITRKEIVLYVDCANGARFFYSERDIKAGTVVASKQSKTAAFSDEQLIDACETSVKSQLKYPLSFNRKWTSISVYRAPGGNVVVQFEFEAKNPLGGTLPQTARCYTDDRGMSPAKISAR